MHRMVLRALEEYEAACDNAEEEYRESVQPFVEMFEVRERQARLDFLRKIKDKIEKETQP